MFCPKCGAQMADDDMFCMKCGAGISVRESDAGSVYMDTGVEGNTGAGTDEGTYEEPKSVQKKKLGDGAIDALSSKLAGGKIETVRVSMEDMLEILNKHYIIPASTDKEYKEIQKTVNGAAIGVSHMRSKDNNYEMRVKIAMQLGGNMDVLHPGDSNWIRVEEIPTGKIYQYSSFTWGKFKKAVKEEISKAKK